MTISARALLSILIGLAAGTASAAFLVLLDFATRTREANPNLVYLLPAAGLAIGYAYHRFGRTLESGTDLILDQIHEPTAPIPARFGPLILGGTLLTHVVGGSAGREGTAVQLGAGLADALGRRWFGNAKGFDRRWILTAGVAAGFGSVFGVPLAGAVFGMEAPTRGRLRITNVLGCLIASYVGHYATLAWGVRHVQYPVPIIPVPTLTTLSLIAAAGVVFGLTAGGFVRLTHLISDLSARLIKDPRCRPVAGGVLLILCYAALGTDRYMGLGVPIIREALINPSPARDFILKLLLTALTLGFGFKGGEVTPLLFIGATLGGALAGLLPLDTSALAALGFVAVFAGAAKTPLTAAVMAGEIFGTGLVLPALIACVISALASGSVGLYGGQRPSGLRAQVGRLYMAIARSRRSE